MSDEYRVIGALIESGAKQAIKPEWFDDSTCKRLAASIARLKDNNFPIDIDTVCGESGMDLGDIARIIRDANPANIEWHLGRIQEDAIRRDLLKQLQCGDPLRIAINQAQSDLKTTHLKGNQPEGMTLHQIMNATFKPPNWVVPDLIPEGMTILAGKPKLGKSWMLLGFGVAVSSGGIALSSIPVEQGDVLYLALEDNFPRIQRRALQVLQQFSGSDRFHVYTKWPRLHEGGIEKMQEWLESTEHPKLIMVDTFQKVRPTGGRNQYEADYLAGSMFQEFCIDNHVGGIACAHTRKAESDDTLDDVSGTLGFAGAADAVHVLKRERGQMDGSLFITGRDLPEEKTLALSFDQKTAIWEIKGDYEDYDNPDRQQEVLDIFKGREDGLSAKEAAELLGDDFDNIRQVVYRLRNRGKLFNPPGSRKTYLHYSYAKE